MIQDIADALVQSWQNFARAFVLFVPRLVAATIIFAGGLVVSLIVRRAIQRLLVWLRFDRLSLRAGASEMLRKAEMPTAEVLVGKMVLSCRRSTRCSSGRFKDSSMSSSDSFPAS